MNTKTILLTGGAGFIGFHTAKALLTRGDRVIIVDNLNYYYDPSIKESRLKELEKISTNLLVKRIDICEYQDLEEIFKSEKINTVVNLAAQAGVRYSISHPFTYEKTNIRGFLNLLELCRHHDVKDFVFASSSSVYGANTKMPFSEDDKVDTPLSLYAASKKSNEEMAYTYHHLYGLNCTGLRFFTVYGPWGRPDMALFLFTDAIVKNKPINVFNNGEMARDFTYIDDIVSGMVTSIDKSFAYEIFNLARGESVRLMDYIKEIENNLGKVAVKNMMPMQAGDVPKSDADISKARKFLGYNPQTSVKEGIKNFVEWYKEYYKTE